MLHYLKSSVGKLLKRSLFKSSAAGDVVLANNRYGVYCIPASHTHRPAAKALMAGEVWEPETIEFIFEYCAAGDLITAGAWAGESLPALCLATSPDHTVWAFEPNPESFRFCAATVLLNDLKNVRLLNAALGDRPDTKNLIVRDCAGLSLGGACQIIDVAIRDGKSEIEAVAVSVVTIDEVVPNTTAVSIIQLDVEGYEEFALVGAARTIEMNRPRLILETVPTSGSMAGQFLDSLGYQITRRLDSENVLLECLDQSKRKYAGPSRGAY
ncbi:MAG TPA: FkbM family methyltransferase [Rhizomicrobium sp.]|jgi:FkbM family methyltransferase|nr:FkbM family methyltransferase [Rhizomicrobium sp.]